MVGTGHGSGGWTMVAKLGFGGLATGPEVRGSMDGTGFGSSWRCGVDLNPRKRSHEEIGSSVSAHALRKDPSW